MRLNSRFTDKTRKPKLKTTAQKLLFGIDGHPRINKIALFLTPNYVDIPHEQKNFELCSLLKGKKLPNKEL
jgi:hypothetical protein